MINSELDQLPSSPTLPVQIQYQQLLKPREEQCPRDSNQDTSNSLPQPLISQPSPDLSQQFTPSKPSAVSPQVSSRAYITFNPIQLHKRYNRSTPYQDLAEQQKKLREQMNILSDLLTQMKTKHVGQFSDQDSLLQQKNLYSKLQRNLKEEYAGYDFMSSGQYALRLDEEYNRLKAYSCTLKQEVRELTKELNTPVLRKVFDEDTAIEKMERQIYDLQNALEGSKAKLMIKANRLKENQIEINRKKKECRRFDKEQLQFGGSRKKDEAELQEMAEVYYQLLFKMQRLAKIRENEANQRVVKMNTRKKQVRTRQSAIDAIEERIDKCEVNIEHKKLQFLQLQSEGTKAMRKHKRRSISEAVSSAKIRHTNGLMKGKVTQLSSATSVLDRHIAASECTFNTQGSRAELLQRNKRNYVQLERYAYFKNIENNENKLNQLKCKTENQEAEVKSPLLEDKSFIRSWKMESFGSILPQLTEKVSPMRDIPVLQLSEGNKDVLGNLSQLKITIAAHNQQMIERRRKQCNYKNSYKEVCERLRKDRLLIEEDCEYELCDLIYNSKY